MALLAGKSPTERNKIIAASALGLVALVALYLAFGRSLFGGSTTSASPKASPTPTPRNTAAADRDNKFRLPTPEEQNLNIATPVMYSPQSMGAPDPGRNIFAFYEPPPPCPECPPPPVKPSPTPPIPTPTPIPTPPIIMAGVNPTMVYAGQKAFKISLNGQFIPPDAKIYFNQRPLDSSRVTDGSNITAEVPASLIASPGQAQILVQTPDGTKYSNPQAMMIQAPPKPTVVYIGMIGRARFNNDTAYFTDQGKTAPFGARLNDVVNSRFRLVDMTPAEVILEDVSLGFRHKVAISKTPTTTTGPGQPPPNAFQNPFPQQMEIAPGIPMQIGPGGVPIPINPGIPIQTPPQQPHNE
jgi:hypothetical protein